MSEAKMTTVTLEDLSPENKKRVWEYLQEKEPALANWVTDPWVDKLTTTFNGKREVQVDRSILLL